MQGLLTVNELLSPVHLLNIFVLFLSCNLTWFIDPYMQLVIFLTHRNAKGLSRLWKIQNYLTSVIQVHVAIKQSVECSTIGSLELSRLNYYLCVWIMGRLGAFIMISDCSPIEMCTSVEYTCFVMKQYHCNKTSINLCQSVAFVSCRFDTWCALVVGFVHRYITETDYRSGLVEPFAQIF
jgi:hypothetical protein